MADELKEMKEAIAEGVARLIAVDQARQQLHPFSAGRTVGGAVNVAGGTGVALDNRFTTGYDPGSGKTTVAFVLGLSPMDGTDILSM